MEYVSKTQLYLKVKKPLLERQRRARINKCLISTRGLSTELVKAILNHLGCQFVRLQELKHQQQSKLANQRTNYTQQLTVNISSTPLSPASSGYHSDRSSPASSPAGSDDSTSELWRPW